jgi:hypothetical protein
MHSKDYNVFAAAFNKPDYSEKVAWLRNNQQWLEKIAEANNCTPFEIIIKLLKTYYTALQWEYAVEMFRANLHLIRFNQIREISHYFSNLDDTWAKIPVDVACDIINEWDAQSSEEKLTKAADIILLASYHKTTDLVAFFRRHEFEVKAIADGTRPHAPVTLVSDILFAREESLTPDIVRESLKPYLNTMSYMDLYSLGNAMRDCGCTSAISSLCLAWIKLPSQQQDANRLSFIGLQSIFTFTLSDNDRIPFLKACLHHISVYAKTANLTELAVLLILFRHIKEERNAVEFAKQCFPYIKTQDDLTAVIRCFLIIIANDRIKTGNKDKTDLDKCKKELVAAYQQYKDNLKKVSTSEGGLFAIQKKSGSHKSHSYNDHHKYYRLT